MKIRLILFLSLTILFMSCRSGKLHKKGVDAGQGNEFGEITDAEINRMLLNEIDFKQVRLKSNVDAQMKFMSQKFPINIQMQKDSIIWASVTMGLELARVKITTDSLILLDRFNRTAYLGTWEDLSAVTKFNFDFNMFQSMLFGNIFNQPESSDQIENHEGFISIMQNRGQLGFQSKLDKEIWKIFEVTGKDYSSGTEALLTYKSFVNLDEKILPTIINLTINDQGNSNLEIKHSDIEFSDGGLNFSFSIPKAFKIKEIKNL